MSDFPVARLETAFSQHQNGRLDQAIPIYGELLASHPGEPNTAHLLAVALYQSGDAARAVEHVECALEAVPDAAPFLLSYGQILVALGRKSDAEQVYEKVLALVPDDLDARANLANLHSAEGRLDAAEKEYRRIIEYDESQYAAHNNLALVLKRKGDERAALEHLQRAVALNTDYFDGLTNLGNLQASLGDYEAAIGIYRRAALLDDTDAAVQRALGDALLQADRADEGLDVLTAAAVAFPDDVPTQLRFGKVLQEFGDLEGAERVYRKVLRGDLRNPHALNNLGTILQIRSGNREALEAFEQALEADETHADAHFNRAAVLFNLDRFPDAEQGFLNALAFNPELGNALELLALLYERTGDESKLTEVLDRWQSVDPDNPIRQHLAGALGAQERPRRCSAEYIRTEFNRVAHSYDRRMKELGYRLPERLALELAGPLAATAPATLDVLDGGCGTGLCGRTVKRWAKRLVGVDLAENMLRLAANRGCYDRLERADLIEHCLNAQGDYDLCILLEVLTYFGDISELVSAVRQALRPGGHLVASLEALDASTEYLLMPNGRYRHNLDHVYGFLAQAGFDVGERQSVILRIEKGSPIWGELILARLPD